MKIKVIGKTNPFTIKIATDEKPFEIDDFFEIQDKNNNNPICRVIKSESVLITSLAATDRDLSADIVANFAKTKVIYIATAKIENYVKKPIEAGADLTIPTFDKIKPYIVKPNISDSFLLGEVNGTNSFYESLPANYKDLFMVRKEEKMVDQTGVPFLLDYKKMTESPHIGLFGGSGSGKTFALKVITEELMSRRIPIIMFDPHVEMNFGKSRDDIPVKLQKNFSRNFEIFTIGKNIGIDFSEIKTDELISIMEFSGEMSGAMSNFLRELHVVGDSFSLTMNKIKKLMRISELIENRKFDRKKADPDDIAFWDKYSGSIPGTGTLIAVSWRLNSLDSEGIFSNNIDGLHSAIMQQKACILRGEMKALNILGSYLLNRIYSIRKQYIDQMEYGGDAEKMLPFIVAMDEAHIFCPKSNAISPIRNILKTIAQEGRKYGVFEIMATQRPSLLDETIVSQMSTKFIFKLSIKEDLLAVQKETDLSIEEMERLPYLNSGESFCSSSIIGKTTSVLIRYNVTTDKSKINPFDEVDQNKLSSIEDTVISLLPINHLLMPDKLDEIQKLTGKTYSVADITSILENLASNGLIHKEKSMLGTNYSK